MSVLKVFNRTIRMFNTGVHPTKARLLALQYLSGDGDIIQELCDYFTQEYPQWLHLIEDCSPFQCCNIIIRKLHYTESDAWNGYSQFFIRPTHVSPLRRSAVEREME